MRQRILSIMDRRTQSSLLARLHPSKTTVRWRLTLLYGSLCFVCGVVLLAITYALVAHAGITPSRPAVWHHPHPGAIPLPSRARPGLKIALNRQRIADLHALIVESGIALAIMAIVSGALAWVLAGRVLRPLRTITATTREISEASLHQRLAMSGPRDELREVADTIDGLLGRLETAFDAQRRFVANASHELRTPLTTMRTTLDVAIAKPGRVPPQVTALDANLREDLDQADRLLESFLTLARAQEGEISERTLTSLASLVERSLDAHGEEIAARQLVVHTALGPVSVPGSETLLTRMVDNVIANAAHHTQTRGLLDITLELDRDQARLSIETSGPALDPDAVAQLAQPFRRLGAERTGSQDGHGLGLSIVASIATAHGGALDLLARPQGGLRVQITLPGATVPARTAAAPA